MSARTILKHVYENGGMTEYQYERIDRVLKERERPHGEWIKKTEGLPHLVTIVWFVCSECGIQKSEETPFCPICGASMSANDRQVTGKLNEEPKDSHAEYWNSIGEWKEGDEK